GHTARAGAVAPEAKGDLLRHGAARHEDGGLFAEQARDIALEALDDLAAAVVVARDRRVGPRGELGERVARRAAVCAPDEAPACGEDGLALGRVDVRWHTRDSTLGRARSPAAPWGGTG